MLAPGTSAPSIELPDLEANVFSLADALRGGPVVLVFFKVSCPTCQMTFPYLQKLADSRNTSAQLIAISQDDAGDSREFRQRLGVSMRTLLDAGPLYKASNAYRIDSVPSFFVIETDGTIALAFDGFNKSALEQVGRLFGVEMFHETDRVPALRPG
jgi:peroxiredoxin